MPFIGNNQNEKKEYEKSAYQQNVSQPIEIDKPVQSARQETLGKIYKIAETNPEKAKNLYGLYAESCRTPGTPVYNQYAQPTNQAVGELAKYGINANGMTTDWFKQNNSWQQYLIYNGTTNTPSKPGKKASDNEWKAYWTYQIYKSAEDTDKAEREWSALKQELSWKAKNPGRNDSDDEIINGIDWKKYPTLAKMQETEGINPVELNRGIGFSKDDMYGTLWAARNGYEGDNSDYAIAMGALGQGNVWQENAELRAKLNWNNRDTYSPYSAGMTLGSDVGMYFNMTSFNADDIERLRQTIDPNDATATAMFDRVWGAWENTQKAEAELKTLEDKVDRWIKQNKSKETIIGLTEKYINNNCPTLTKIDESIQNGSKLVETTKAINYKKQDFLTEVGKYCDEAGTKLKGEQFITDIEKDAAPVSPEPQTPEKAPAAPATPKLTEQEKAIIEEQNKALADAGTIVDEVGTPVEKAASVYSWSATFDAMKNAVKAVRDSFDGQVNGLIQQSIKSSISDTANATLTGADVIANYERDAAKLDEINKRCGEIEATLGDLIYAGMNENTFNRGTVEVNVDGVPRIVRAEFNRRTGEYEITSIARKDGLKVPSDSATHEKIMEEAQKRFAGVKETRDRAMSVAGVAMSDEEKALLDEYNALSSQRNSLVQTQNENTAAYNEAKDKQIAAEAKRTAVISMMEKAGVPTEELKVFEETGAVIDVLKGFTQYDPTVWESFNAYDLYAQAIAFEGADSYDKVFADAKEGDAKNRQELETALWILDYSERNGIDVPENIKGNINRYIAKLERDHKDFEYFSVLQNKDFKEMAQRGRERVDAAGWDWGSFDGSLESQPAWGMLSDEQKDQLLGMMDTYDINDIAATFENMVANNAGDPVEDRLFGLFQAGNLMSNYEIDTYYYLLAKEGQEAADAYYNHLADSSYGALTVRSRDALEAGAQDLADQGFWGRRAADALSIIQAPAAAFGSFAYGVEYGVKKLAGQEVEYNPNNPWLSFNQFRTAARAEIQSEITKTYGEGSVAEKIFSTMQEIISNRGDSMMNMMAFGWLTNGMTSEMAQEFVGALPMAAGAAADVMAQAKERGASDAQAWMVGSIALLCEAGTEAISIDNISKAFKIGQEVEAGTVKEFLKNWVKKAGWSEALGESLNDYFENAADEAFMGPLSEHARRVAELKEADPNMTDEEADAQARREEFSSILHTAITSFLSPGMDVIPLAAGRVNYLRAQTKFAKKQDANVNILDVMKADKAIREQGNAAAANGVSETMSAATEQAEASEAETAAEGEAAEAEAAETAETAETEATEAEAPQEETTEATEQAEQEATEAEAPQEEASEEDAGAAAPKEETEDEKWERWGKEDFLKKPLAEYSLLLKAKYADVKEQTALLAGVFDEDGTDGSSEIAKATATALSDFLSDNSLSKNKQLTLEILENLYEDAEHHKLDIKTLKRAICTAVLGGENSAAFEAFNSMKHQSVRGWFWTDRMHEESIAQKLVKSVEQDSADPAVQENIRKAVREYRVAEAEGRLIAENAEPVKVQLAAAKSLQEKADKAEDNLISAKYRMERRFYAMKASAEAVQKATQNMNSDPSDQNKKALTSALAKHESNSVVYEQSQMEVENLTKISEDAAAASKYAQNEAMNAVRKAAEQMVAQEDQQRQQAAEQMQAEEEQRIEQERLAQEEEDRATGKLAEDERRALIDQQVDKLNLNEETAEKVRSQLYQFDQDLNIGKADTSKLLSDVDAALAMNAISRKLGVAIEVGSLPEGKDGRYSNGKIVLSDRLTVGQAMVEVALHEITHSLEKTKSYGKYKDTVMGILFNSPAAMEKAIQDKIDFYERNGVNLGDTLAQKRAAAEAEIVADFAKDSKTFANKQTIQRMMDAGLGGRIRNALHNVNQYLKNMKLSGDERVKAENLRRAERLYQKALNERANASAHPSAEQFSVNQFAEAAGLHYQETNITDENGNVIAKSGLYTADPSQDRNAKRVDKVTPKMIEGTPVGELTNAALALGTMNKETVGKVHKMFADLMTMCADLQDSNLVWEIAGSTLYSEFSAIKANSDKQYSNTVDFGTICTKTQAVINQLSRDMLRLGRGLTSKEILQVYNDVYNADLKVPCPVCYVFSRWLGVPSLLENIRQYQNRFLGEPGAELDRATVQKQVDDFIKNAHKEYGIGKTDKELELYKENVSKARNKAEDAVDRTNKKIAKEEAKIAGYEDKLKQNPLRNDWIRNKASAEKRLAALQEELANKKTALDNVEVEAYSKTINKKKADIEKSIKDKTIKIEGSDKGERGIMDDIRDRIKEGKPYEDLLKKREKIQGEIDDLYKKLREVDAYNWVTQALCKMDRDGNFVVDDDFVRTKDEVLLDLRRTGEFARDVKNWTYRSTRGAGMGKAILPYSGASIGDSVLGIGARSMANPFKDHDADRAFAALRDNIIKAKRQNLIGGQRFQSTSDFRPEWGLDYIMTFIEQQALGSNGQLYTKVNEAVPLYASVGIDTNCSIMPYADGYHFPEAGEVEKMSEQEKKSRVITFKDDTGNETTVVLDFSDVTGMPYEYAQPLSKAYDSVQMIMVGINDIHIRACLAGEEIDFVIPWHSSGNTKGQLQSMMKTVDETLTNSSDYTKVQTDQIAYKKDLETAHGKEERGEELTDHEKDLLHKEELRDARERLITGKTLTATDIARIGESKYLTSLYERFMGKTLDGKELKHDPKYWVELPDGKGGTTSERVTLTSGQAEQIFPYEYWDTSLTKDKADENGWRFVEYCQELGLVPRFSGGNQKNDDGSITRFGNFSGAEYDNEGNITGFNRDKMAKGYWKTLIDRKMYDNNGNYRDQQQIDASKVQAGRLERNAEGTRELTDSNIPVATEGANYSGAEAERKYQQADDAFRSRIEEKAASGDKQAQEDLKRMQAYDDAHATDIEQYDLSGDTNPNLELTEGEMLQMLKDAGLDYQDALNRGDPIAAAEDADFIDSYSSYPVDVDISRPNEINPDYTDHDGDPVTNDAVEKSDVNVQYSLRTIAPPQKTKKCFKAFYVKDGKLYPPMVSNNTNEEDIQKGTKLTSGTMRGLETPVGVWLDADVGGLAVDDNGEPIRTSTTGRLRVKNDKGGDSLAFRPGWHLGEWPDATQFYKTDPITGQKKSVMPDDLVFAECEIAADIDYQIEALELGVSEKGKFNRTQAGLPRVPVDGYYKYRTNANPSEAPWYITGAMKVTRILTDEECRQECEKHGVKPAERYSHHDINLEEYGLKAGEVTPTEDLERFAKNQASYDNDALLERALNDERYSDAYKRRPLNFNDPTIRNEFMIDRIDDEQFEKYRSEYQPPESQWSVNDAENENLTEGEMLQMLKDAGALSEEDAAKYSITPNDQTLVKDGTLTEKELNRLNLSDRGEGERQFNTVTSQKSDVFNERALQYLKDHNHYVKDTNSAELARAILWINANATEDDPTGYQKSLGMVTSPSFNSLTKDGQARMVAMLGMAAAQGNTHDQVLLLRNYGKQGTNIAQALQARKLFSLMTPEGRMRAIDRVLTNAAEGMKKGQKDVQLEFSDWIYRAAAAAESPQDFDRVRQAAMNELAEQIPASWKDRVRSIRMLSMLANPRTHIRNIIGNALFVPAVSMKNKLGAVMELGVKRGNKTKTLALRVPGEIRNFAKEIAKEQKGMLTGEAKFNEATVIKKAQSKLGGFLDALSTFNSNALEAEDWLFLKGHFTRSFGGWMQANKYTVDQVRNDQALMEKGVTYAIEEAQKATYRDFNKAASILNDASRKGGAVGFLVDAALPFKKTPANILRRGIEYSPVGIVKSLTVDMIRMKKGDLTPSQVLDHFCAGLSGTAITALGFLLAGSGMVSCGLDDDEDKLEKAKGAQEYAVNFGKLGNAVAEKLGVPKLFGEDVTFTMDWAAPMAMPFFVGAAIREQMEQGGEFDAEAVVNAFGNITEPVFNLSMLDGVNTLFKTSQYDDTNTITQIGAKVLTNYATSYVPSVLGAISRTFFDDKQRKAFVKQGEGTGPIGTVRYAIEQAENKIPGLAQTNIAVRDIWGREKTTGLLERIMENFILPGYISKIEDDPILNEMGRLYDATGDAGMIPKEDPEKKISWTKNKVKHEHVLTAEEWDKYKEVRNGTAHAELTELINNPDYQNATDDVRTKMIKDVWSHATDVGRNALFPEYELDSKGVKEIAKDSKLASYKEEIIKALDAENYDAYDTMVEAIRAEYDDEAEADATIKTKLGNAYRDKWKDAYKNGDDARMLEIEDILDYTGFNFNIYGKGGWQEKVDDQ